MDVFDLSFLLSTLWIGPFWVAMLLNPFTEKTKNLLDGYLFFLGPIFFWIIALLFSGSSSFSLELGTDQNFIDSLAGLLGTKAGMTATWAHMVAGDIFATRWIWKKAIQTNASKWLRVSSIFFGVMLMPVGVLLITLGSMAEKKKSMLEK